MLYLGIVFFPLIFYWFLLRKGHSITARVLWGIYAAVSTLFGLVIIAAIVTAIGGTERTMPTYAPTAPTAGSMTNPAPAMPSPPSAAVSGGQGFGSGLPDNGTMTSLLTAETSGDAVRVSSAQLAQAFEQNEVAAQMQYKGKTLYVEGTVTGVTLDIMDNPVIQLEGANQFMPVQATFDKSYAQVVSQVSKGQRVTVICREISEVVSVPMLDSCSL